MEWREEGEEEEREWRGGGGILLLHNGLFQFPHFVASI